jgi:hypothetical protein
MKKLMAIFPCALLALSVSAASNNKSEYADMQKQLNIMSDIIKSSVGVQEGRKGSKISNIQSTYLRGQGVVFTISSGSHSKRWGNFNFNFTMPDMPVMPEMPPMPVMPVASVSDHDDDGDNRYSQDISERMSDAFESANRGYERAMESMERSNDIYRDLKNAQRDLRNEVRDLQREKRDMEYQMRRADDKSKAELGKQIERLSMREAEFEKERAKLSKKSELLRKEQMTQRTKQDKDRGIFYKDLNQSLAETLCLYGNGLKALPENENVSLIIKSGGIKENGRYRDQVFVFSKKDISACSSDKITSAKLLINGNGYQF